VVLAILTKCLSQNEDFAFFNGDDPIVRAELDTPNTKEIENILAGKKTVFIDEAQRIKNISLTLKIITNQFKDLQL
jgi:predicted AAA+ superfamily ATPase